MLERLDPNPEYWEGKRGACVGVFQMIIAGREDRSVIYEDFHNSPYTLLRQALADVIQILRNVFQRVFYTILHLHIILPCLILISAKWASIST